MPKMLEEKGIFNDLLGRSAWNGPLLISLIEVEIFLLLLRQAQADNDKKLKRKAGPYAAKCDELSLSNLFKAK
ncbi:MAG: hypothetical protein EOO07_12530 [Chitinophagaceae bacterium]|nr:MAG: hypothetical protein EOO07_12530 [Chitinophagaceae bacterium]